MSLPRRAALRSRRKTIGDSSSGSKADEQHGGGGLAGRRTCGPARARRRRARRNVGLLGARAPGAEVDAVGAERRPGEPGVGVGSPRASAARRSARPHEPPAAASAAGGRGDGLGPGRARTRRPRRRRAATSRRSVARYGKAKRPLSQFHSSLTSRVVPGQAAHAPSSGGTSVRSAQPRGAVLADRRGGDQVERAGPEPVGRAGQGADRADLHGVAREVGVERRVLADADLLAGRPRSRRSMNGSPAISSANRVHRAHDTQRSRSSRIWARRGSGLGNVRFVPVNRDSGAAVAHRLVLQRALATLVADRAVERMVDQQELHDALLRRLGDRRRERGADLHALGDRDRAGGLRLGLALDLDQARAAGRDRLEQRVVAEPRDLDARPARRRG